MPLKKSSLRRFYKGQKVLVAGGAGFIGASLIKKLLSQEASVTILIRSNTPWRVRNIKKGLKIVRADLNEKNKLERIIGRQKPQIIFNLAATIKKGRQLDILREQINGNFISVLNLLEAARKTGVKKFIQVGSALEYGDIKPPFYESQKESPNFPHALSKVLATNLVMFYGKTSALQTCVARPTATFGPAQNFNSLIPNLIRACFTKKEFAMNPGEQIRDFLFVEDLTDGLLDLGASTKIWGQIVNFGGKRYKIKHVAQTIKKLAKSPLQINFGKEPYRPSDPMRFFADSRKAKKLLGWKLRTNFKTALLKTIKWYKDHPKLWENLTQ